MCMVIEFLPIEIEPNRATTLPQGSNHPSTDAHAMSESERVDVCTELSMWDDCEHNLLTSRRSSSEATWSCASNAHASTHDCTTLDRSQGPFPPPPVC